MNKYALIGRSLGHSFSKAFFTDYFEKNNIDASYSNLELAEISEFEKFKDQYDGFNVTIPYKEAIIPYLDEVDPEALEIGAVNTVALRNGKWVGFNTDAYGFHQSIKPFFSNKHERAMILGTGGASKAIYHVLDNLGVNIIYISRTPDQPDEFGYSEVNNLMLRACKLIVNCTPVGTAPNFDESPLSNLNGVSEDHLVVDLIYNPEKSRLLQMAEEKGAMILNGMDMLKAQALKSYEIWQENV